MGSHQSPFSSLIFKGSLAELKFGIIQFLFCAAFKPDLSILTSQYLFCVYGQYFVVDIDLGQSAECISWHN